MESRLESNLWDETMKILGKPLPVLIASAILIADFGLMVSACSVIQKHQDQLKEMAHEAVDEIIDEAGAKE